MIDMRDEIILAIESSCDETAIAILRNGDDLLVNSVNTQIEEHKRFGGVYPELASRLHLKNITSILSYSLSLKGFDFHEITHVAVTAGPGLPGALQIGNMAAKTIADYLDVPLIQVHHLVGHIYANEFASEFRYPLLALIASGGNTELIYLPREMEFELIGETQDDAVGEAMDKVARELGLPYPGGVSIDEMTRDQEDIPIFKLPAVKTEGYDFSFSGLKAHLVREIKKEREKTTDGKLSEDIIKSYARSTEVGFMDQLIDKTYEAALATGVKQVIIGGGVSANSYLRQASKRRFEGTDIEVVIPPLWCTTDNAAMIAKVAHHLIRRGRFAPLDSTSYPDLEMA